MIDADLREIRRYGLCGFDRWIRHRSSNVYGSVDAREERLGDAHRRAVGQAAPFECLAIDVVRIGADAAQRFAHHYGHERRDHDADDAQRFQRVPDDARQRLIGAVLFEMLPRLASDDVAVDCHQELPHHFQRPMKREIVHLREIFGDEHLRRAE